MRAIGLRLSPFLAAAASGVLFAISFPNFNIFPLAFVFLLPLLIALERTRARAFGMFLIFGITAYLILLYWMPRVMIRYGGMSPALSVLAFLLVVILLSLVTAVAGWGMGRLVRVGGYGWLAIPLLWVGKDLVLEVFMTGFPWCLVGYSQYRNILFLQTASIGGVHLVGFLLILTNLLLFQSWRLKRKGPLLVLAAILLLVYGGGWLRIRNDQVQLQKSPIHRAIILQPNSHHDRRLSWIEREQRLEELLNQSASLVAEHKAELVVWPEYSVTLYPLQNTRFRDRILEFTRDNATLLAGFTDIQAQGRIKNAMVRFDKEGTRTYHKVHLTPFGEYIPFRWLFFFVSRVVDEIVDFTPGDSLHALPVNGHRAATPICFEVIFPRLVRRLVAKGGELIVTISNDSWFGDTSAPRQHLIAAVLRSVENHRYTLRSTSNGISSAISPTGRILHLSPYGREDAFCTDYRYLNDQTIFLRWGWMFPLLCLMAGLLILAASFKKRNS